MDWKERALSLLKDSLEPVPSELNEIDWKGGLSDQDRPFGTAYIRFCKSSVRGYACLWR